MYNESTISDIAEESFNIEIPSEDEYYPTDISNSDTSYEPADLSINRIVHELEQGFTDGDDDENTIDSAVE